jgi:hypothetical protein
MSRAEAQRNEAKMVQMSKGMLKPSASSKKEDFTIHGDILTPAEKVEFSRKLQERLSSTVPVKEDELDEEDDDQFEDAMEGEAG